MCDGESSEGAPGVGNDGGSLLRGEPPVVSHVVAGHGSFDSAVWSADSDRRREGVDVSEIDGMGAPSCDDELDVHRRAVAGIRRASAEGLLTAQEAQSLIDRVRACGTTAPPPRKAPDDQTDEPSIVS